MSYQRRPDLLTEYGRLQRRVLLEEKYQMLRGNPAEESGRANISSQVEEDLKEDSQVEPDQLRVEEDLKEDLLVEVGRPRVEHDSPIKPQELKMGLPLVVIVGADKGGVGKTTVSRAVLDYFKAQGRDARAFDTETPHGVLKRFHPAQTEVVELTSSDGQIQVFDTLSPNSVTVIDVRAGLLTPTLKLLSEIGFLDLVQDGKVRVAVLHVIGSTVASFNEIDATAKILAGAQHFVVTNHTNDAAFFEGIDGVAKDVLSKSPRIDIPKLDERATEHVEAASMPFSDFTSDEGKSFVMRGKVRVWLKQVFAQLDTAKFNS
jgi:hypothetical protein